MRMLRFKRNMDGRDFVVGDIHGCFDALRDRMVENVFDERRDRLFSVGDLVDRGTQSEEAIEWIAKPWFHAVRGNHEQMAIGVAEGKHDLGNYVSNGGAWFLNMPESRRKVFAKAFDDLPFAIEIDHVIGRVGIVHAEIVGTDWDEFAAALEQDQSNNRLRNILETVLWARSRITAMDQTEIDGIRVMYVGHTPVTASSRLGNVFYIDTGCVFGRDLTMMEIL